MTIKHAARLRGPVTPYVELAYDDDGAFMHLGVCITASLRYLWTRISIGLGPISLNIGLLGPNWRQAENTP